MRIKEGAKWKTAFNCPLGCYQFCKAPPPHRIHATDEVLHEHLYKGILVYLDNILIYTESPEKHVKLVRTVLRKLQEAQL